MSWTDDITIDKLVEPVCKSKTDSANLESLLSKHYEPPPFPIFGPDQRKCNHCLRKILNLNESLVSHLLERHQTEGLQFVSDRIGQYSKYLVAADKVLKELNEKKRTVNKLLDENERLKMKIAELELKVSDYEEDRIVID